MSFPSPTVSVQVYVAPGASPDSGGRRAIGAVRDTGAGIIAAVHLWSGKQSKSLPRVCTHEGEPINQCMFAHSLEVKFIICTSYTSKPLQHEKYIQRAAAYSRKTPIYIIACYLFSTQKALEIHVFVSANVCYLRLRLLTTPRCRCLRAKKWQAVNCVPVLTPCAMSACSSSSLWCRIDQRRGTLVKITKEKEMEDTMLIAGSGTTDSLSAKNNILLFFVTLSQSVSLLFRSLSSVAEMQQWLQGRKF